jgi:two-component system response regulator
MKQALQNILLIEDDEAHAEIFIFYAQRFDPDLKVTHLPDGEAAFRYLDQLDEDPSTHPDLVVLDLNLPRYSGLEVLQRIKEDVKARRIPVVILSSSSSNGDITAAWSRGVNSYLRKPMEQNAFEPLIKKALDYWAQNDRAPTAVPET